MNGKPVDSLNNSDLRVTKLMVPKEFYRTNVSIKSVEDVYTTRKDLRIYENSVVPERNWSIGGYVLLIEVQKGNDLGQAMVSFTNINMPPPKYENLPVGSVASEGNPLASSPPAKN